jgi:hypothetical protein
MEKLKLWKDGNASKGQQDLLLLYQSGREFDPVFGKVGEIITKKDYYAKVSAEGLIWETVWEAARGKGTKLNYRAKGGWFAALKWDGSDFRVIGLAITPILKDKAIKYVQDCINSKTKLNLLSEYSFAVHAGDLMSDGTQLTH